MRRRNHFYVVHAGDRWDVSRDGGNVVERFGRKAHALRAAIRAAEAMWSEDGVPTTVRVHVAPGQWQDARKFG